MWVDIRQLGWRWRYAGRHCCNEMVMCILTTEVLFSPALILTSEHKQNGVLTPTRRTCHNVVTYHSSFRYINIINTFQWIKEFYKSQIVIFIISNMWLLQRSNKSQCIYSSCIPPWLSYHPDKAAILRNEAIASQYVSWKQGNRIAEEVCRTQLLQFDIQVVHLDDWSSFQSRPNFDVRAKSKWRPHPHSYFM
jgi:hypothetical protein